MPPAAVEAIARRRRQILVHSCAYYSLDNPVISDHQWDKWARQLAKLQAKYGWRIGFYDEAFRDWEEGTSGFKLPFDADVMRVTRRIVEEVEERRRIIG